MTDIKLPSIVNNRSLFSDYYLQSLIKEQPQWAETPEIESVLAQIKARYESIQPTAEKWVEAQTEREFIQPVLQLLGHAFEVQPTLPTSQGAKRPDYAFFASDDAKNAAQAQINTRAFFKTAIAIGDAKAWRRDLDRKIDGSGDAFSNSNPSYQIDFYLRETDKLWGILTNGRQWRLYHRQTSYRLDSFYEVDLAALLTRDDVPYLDAFRYFYCLFRRDAFLPGDDGKSFLDTVLEGSQQHTVGISADLKERVYEALRLLIGGFLDYPRNGFDKANPPLDEIQTNCLILLYRTLFILYAESRGLLPVENPDYTAHYSLGHLATEIHEKLDRGDLIIPAMSDYWARLRGLFALINAGWADLIPQYNGGLFNPERHPFLEKYELGNDATAQVVELLTRTERKERIVYRDLEVRHLGSIYEGLLEYKPQLATEDMVIVSRKRGETIEPKANHPDREVAYRASEVYLLTDKGERKATGSYYTPDYIVRYIVENTLAPLCEGKSVDDILKLKVLDPAIGSGHFLVGVVDYLALELATHPDAPLMTEGDSDTEIAYWRRRVVESCVYGVDVNPMAVELAKLSLWLHTVAQGEPLSFLDHHIRCGNSLIGAKIRDLPHLPALKKGKRKNEAAQTEIVMEFPFTRTVATAIGHYLLIEEMESRTADQIHAKEHELDIAQTMLRYHKGVADLWTSVYFGNDVSRSAYHQALNALRSKNTKALENMLCYRRAGEIAAEKQFFHWEIEFPEVFRDRHGRELDHPGFDAVVGNPPYDVLAEKERKENLSDFINYVSGSQALQAATGHKLDLFRLFTAKAIHLASDKAFIGVIIPMSLMADKQTSRLREFLLRRCRLIKVNAFPQKDDPKRRVFEQAKLPTCIVFIQRERPAPFQVVVHPGNQLDEICGDFCCRLKDLEQLDSESLPIPLLTSGIEVEVLRKLAQGNPILKMGRVCPTYQGEINETTMSDLISTDPQVGPRILRGGNVQRYEFIPKPRQGVAKYLNLDAYRKIGGKRTTHTSQERIGYQRNAALDNWRRLIFAPLPTPSYCFDSISYFLVKDKQESLVLLALLNSQLMEWRFRLTSTNNHVSTAEIATLPIRQFSFTTPPDERERLRKKGKTLYELCLSKGSTDCVLGFVEHHLSATPERSDVVHDLLAYLAEQMIEMHKAKGEEIRGFLRWLEREIGTPIDTLKNKTAVQNYSERSLTDLLTVLKRNQKAISVDLSGRAFQEGLEREFGASVGKLTPLIKRIEKTDALIYQVVYRLYGLTDVEIAVVEGRV